MCCSFVRGFPFLAIVLMVGLGAGYLTSVSQSEFQKPVIDIGVVVSDLEVSSRFYQQAIGFQNTSDFEVSADFGKDTGLTDGHGLAIKVFKLADGENATSLKLMQLEGVDSAKVNHQFIHSSLGYSYLTIYVENIDTAMERLQKAEVDPVSKEPVAIEGTNLFLTLVSDPDGNLIELIGPR